MKITSFKFSILLSAKNLKYSMKIFLLHYLILDCLVNSENLHLSKVRMNVSLANLYFYPDHLFLIRLVFRNVFYKIEKKANFHSIITLPISYYYYLIVKYVAFKSSVDYYFVANYHYQKN